MKSAIAEVAQTYGIENWGAGYFDINSRGNLIVRPVEGDPRSVDVKLIVDDLISRRVKLPVLIRFPQIFASQVRKMNQSFRSAMKEFDYKGEHLAVFPLKVNQRKQVIESYLEEGSKYNYGLEAGSKPELYAAIAMDQSPDSLLVCNGFKDDSFIDLAFVGARAGKNVIIVIEKLNELGKVVDRVLETGVRPMVGMRVRLYTRGSGRWEKSGGEQSKFGLTTTELLQAIKMLSDAGMADMLRVLHFHIGSQITQIKRVKAGVKEAARVYAKLRKMGVDVDHLNVGGGAGVDYHDALEHKEELFTLFDLGFISLEDRAKGEVLFWEVCDKANNFAKQTQIKSEEFDDLRKLLSAKYLCNFSVFRSVPDHWAIDQLFPIIPIH